MQTATDFSSHTLTGTFSTKHFPQSLGHCLKERQTQFGGMAIASPCNRGRATQVEGNHHKWPEQALCLPHGVRTTQHHFRDVQHHTRFLPQTKQRPKWPTKVPTWVDRGFKTMQVLLQLREMADKGQSFSIPSAKWHQNKPGWRKPGAASLCLTAFQMNSYWHLIITLDKQSFPTEKSKWYLLTKTLCIPRQVCTHFAFCTLITNLQRNHLIPGHTPSERTRWDVLNNFKYLGTEYTEVSQNTYFSLRREK